MPYGTQGVAVGVLGILGTARWCMSARRFWSLCGARSSTLKKVANTLCSFCDRAAPEFGFFFHDVVPCPMFQWNGGPSSAVPRGLNRYFLRSWLRPSDIALDLATLPPLAGNGDDSDEAVQFRTIPTSTAYS